FACRPLKPAKFVRSLGLKGLALAFGQRLAQLTAREGGNADFAGAKVGLAPRINPTIIHAGLIISAGRRNSRRALAVVALAISATDSRRHAASISTTAGR